MEREEKKNKDRPESYPKPTETDTQLQNQEEFTGMKPNEPGREDEVKSESSNGKSESGNH